ncbi:NRAMP (natural resistance-associated macrophage protein)-like metal ion transporter [Winogradskyella pacifica]|uniref:NRAMP (Natural resistance-associated macrophage protein)-like metal ion transporter n=1 Tax=Winogradskyella pacifica TaxID=664642 RepID=A0A3D9LPF1_9FLAO|nr:Nramp family divalent metal transporter [Winogradskyella pacifica]REE07873.1 NRAMP (natural resistance-associated macrophage protein)-like metal ion transporter [Winogradskyella pacifica]
MKKFFKNIGPGPLVAAAFIGPGTVTVCTLAGVNFGFALLWAMALSIFATVILQEMAARLGIVSQKGLSEIIREEIKHPIVKGIAILLIISAIVIGNAAYEAGNISGGALGMEAIVGNVVWEIGQLKLNIMSLIIGAIAFVLLYIGDYKVLEKAFVFLVILMSFAFITTAILTKPNLLEILKAVVIPVAPEGSILTIIALIGTTVVPYNLFLHASLAKTKWKSKSDLPIAKKDTLVAVILGGTVSMCIIIAASAIQKQSITNTSDLALGLEPLFGSFAKYFLAIGLFAAGITSAITAPLAAAFVTSGCLGWEADLKSKKFKSVWMVIVVLGVVFSSIGVKSIEIIKFAQVANGLLLPVIAGFLLWVMNKSSVLGSYVNSKFQNVLGIIILIITIFLGVKGILSVFNVI